MKRSKTTTIRYKEAPFVQIRQTLHSNRAYGAHAHTTLSIGFMLEGKTSFQTPQGSFCLEHGALAIIPPYTEHACNPLEKRERSYIMVYIDADVCARLQANSFKEATTLLPLTTPLLFHKELFASFEQIILSLMRAYTLLHVKKLEAWLEQFLWLYTKPHPISHVHSPMEKVAYFLQNRLDEPWTLRLLAERFDVNPFVLFRHFKEHFGCTPKHYCLNLRIEHAKKLLQEGTPLALCAHYCGFVDQSHFHRFFKRHTALTPKEYQVNFIQ